MDDDGRALLTIGQLARRTGLPVRTIRFWSDIGAVPPAGRTPGGYRLYDAASVARLELVRTLRELGVGLEDIRDVLAKQTTMAQVAATHVVALDTQIRTLRLNRAVLVTVAKRGSNSEELALMNKLARLSTQQRKQLIDDFLDEVLGEVDTMGVMDHLRQAIPELPEDPTPEQVDAWVEPAELVHEPGFRRGVRALVVYTTQQRPPGSGPQDEPNDAVGLARRIVHEAGAARERGVAPGVGGGRPDPGPHPWRRP
jgi:DNA-binding transcriptional MerR regulator